MDSTIVENDEPTRASPTLSNDDTNTTASSHATGEVVQIQAPPDWAHEVAASRVGRQSRASSIFSTRTRLSNLTLDDARSVEIKAGGLSFRISRDGSRITDVTAPPPYPGPPVDDVVEEEAHERDASSTETEETSSREGSTATTPHLSARRLSTEEEELETHSLASSSATLPAAVYDIPEKLKRALGIRGMNASSPSLQPPTPGHPRRTQSDTSNYGWLRSWSKISAAESSCSNQISSNSAVIGQSENRDEAVNVGSSSTSTIKPAIEEEEIASGSDNEEDERAAEISSHYSGLMRDMDREHRKKLHEKDKELSQLRQLLHEKDIVLRQALRDKDIAYEGLKSHIIAKDVFIEDLKSKLVELEDGVEARLEKARHAVENMWEVRWKTYEKLLLDRMLPGISEDVQEVKLGIANASEITEREKPFRDRNYFSRYQIRRNDNLYYVSNNICELAELLKMSDDSKNILVTGANGGLGLGICLRLIDDFLRTFSSSASLRIIFTTRSKKKATDTLKILQAHLLKNKSPRAHERVSFQAESNVELTNLLSVRDLARRLNASEIPHLDAVICNAGIGGWSGLNWPQAIVTVLADIRNNTTWPPFKLGVVGTICKPQFPDGAKNTKEPEPILGEVFCANLFGHYMLAHWLMPLLRACDSSSPGKIIWISSIEPQAHHFNPDDLQGLRADAAYEHSKRLTDLLNLTSTHPGAARYVESFYAAPAALSSPVKNSKIVVSPPSKSRSRRSDHGPPVMQEMHPGILVTTVIALYWIVHQAYMCAIYLARILGAPWSTVQPYTAALAATWLAFAPETEIEQKQREMGGDSKTGPGTGKIKWGTSVSRFGTPLVQVTDVEQWGINGSGEPFADTWWGGRYAIGGNYGRGRNPLVSADATPEDVEKFVEQGIRAWKEMEELRRDWEKRIEEHERVKDGSR